MLFSQVVLGERFCEDFSSIIYNQKYISARAETSFLARLNNAPSQNDIFGKAPLAEPRMVNERAPWKGVFEGETKISKYEQRRDLLITPLRFAALKFRLPKDPHKRGFAYG